MFYFWMPKLQINVSEPITFIAILGRFSGWLGLYFHTLSKGAASNSAMLWIATVNNILDKAPALVASMVAMPLASASQ